MVLISTSVDAGLTLGLLATAEAHHGACRGWDIQRERGVEKEARRLAMVAKADAEAVRTRISGKRQQATDEASQAKLLGDFNAECGYAPLASVEARRLFYPASYQHASLVSGDTAASSLFTSIVAGAQAANLDYAPHVLGGSYDWANDPNCYWPARLCTHPAPETGLPADISTVPEPNTWGYTFDDGPLCDHNEFYNFMLQNNQKMSLFYIGSQVQQFPLQAQRGFADGHHICVHTWSHPYMTTLSDEQVFAELYYGRAIIKDVLGVTPLCWRPPYGDIDNRVRYFARALSLTTILWARDTDDADLAATTNYDVTSSIVSANYQSILNDAAAGKYATQGLVVLDHELTDNSVNTAMAWYPKLKSAFAHIVPIASAMNWTTPYVEQNITYPDFAAYIAGNTAQNTGAPVPTSASLPGSTSTSAMGSGSGSGTNANPSGSAQSGGAVAANGAVPKTATGSQPAQSSKKNGAEGSARLTLGLVLGAVILSAASTT